MKLKKFNSLEEGDLLQVLLTYNTSIRPVCVIARRIKPMRVPSFLFNGPKPVN